MAVVEQHIMLSYQWDIQPLVHTVYTRLHGMGYPVWMDVEGGISGRINDSMAEAVENACVVVPFMTLKYQASKNCKKELNYTDTLDKNIVPCMAERFKPSSWLGIITAGMLWMDFRNPDNLEQSIESLITELNHHFGDVHLLGEEEREEPSTLFLSALSSFLPMSSGWDVSTEGAVPALEEHKHFLKSRAMLKSAAKPLLARVRRCTFLNATSSVYLTRPDNMLSDEITKDCYWVQERKGKAITYIKNYVSKECLTFNTHGKVGATRVEPDCDIQSDCEWSVMTDESDDSGRRAVVMYNEYVQLYLAVVEGRLEGVQQQSKDCTWYLESGGQHRGVKKVGQMLV